MTTEYKKICPVCRKSFTTTVDWKIFCCYEHSNKYWTLVKMIEVSRLTKEELALRGELLEFKKERDKEHGRTT